MRQEPASSARWSACEADSRAGTATTQRNSVVATDTNMYQDSRKLSGSPLVRKARTVQTASNTKLKVSAGTTPPTEKSQNNSTSFMLATGMCRTAVGGTMRQVTRTRMICKTHDYWD